MKLDIVSCEALDDALSDTSNPIKAWLKPLDMKGVHTRKFITLREQKGEQRIYLVIGPAFVDRSKHPDFYTHSRVRETALEVLGYDKYQIAGGGLVTFKEGLFSNRREACFAGFSRDYGVWDSRLLEHRQAVADWLGLVATFEWQGSASPGINR